MDTSTPVSKLGSHILGGLRRKAIENDCEVNSNVSHSNVPKSPDEDAELVYSQPPNDARLNRSEELFPFSPIPYRKEVPSTLLPLLDTPDMKWSSSLFTSFPAQSENASPEVLSEDNVFRTICVDSHIENNARYTTNSFNSEVPGFPNDTNVSNVPPQDSCVERNSSRPSSPIIVTRKKERKMSSVHKELFPLSAANDEISEEPPASLECGAMGDMTLNALEQICIDSEIMYSKNSSKKSNTSNSFAGEGTSHFIPNSSRNDVFQCQNKRSFIYPYDNVKKPVAPVLMTDILQTVLLLEASETSTKVARKNENFCQGLVCFSQLEPSLSQSAENLPVSPLTVWCDAEIENPDRIAASYEIVRVIYLPVFFCSDDMSINDRQMLTVLKRYFESLRVHFAQLIFKSRSHARRNLSSKFIDCSRSKFPKLDFSAAIIESFFEFFILHPNLMYNYRLSRRFCVPSNHARRTTTKKRTQNFANETQLCSSLVQNMASVGLPEVSHSLMKVDQKSDTSPNKCNLRFEAPSNQNQFIADKYLFSDVPMTSVEMQVSCKEFEEQIDEENEDHTSERQPLHKPTLSSPEKLIQELNAALSTARECNYLDEELLEQAKKLLVTARQKASKNHVERSTGKSNSVHPAVSKNSEMRNQNSSDMLSKTPFEVDFDSADLMFICDLSEKTVLPEKSVNSDVEPFSTKISKVIEKSPQQRKSSKNLLKYTSLMESPGSVSAETKVTAPLICDKMKYSDSTASTRFAAKNHYSPSLVSKSTSVLRSPIRKCTSEFSSGNLVTTPQKSLSHAQTMVLDDIENWNPELAAMMTSLEIKKQLIHTRSSKKDIASSSSNSEGVSAFTNKSAIVGFNTAGGRKINVQPNSLVRAKKSMDAVQVEPETTEKQCLNQKSTSSVSVLEERSSSKLLSKPSNNSKLLSIDDDLLSLFPLNEKINSREDSPKKIKFTTDESLNQAFKPLEFPAFSTASGKKMNVSEKFLATGRKMYESTAEEKSTDEIKPSRNDSVSRFPSGGSVAARKMNSRETKLICPKPSEPSIFQKASTSCVNKHEVESFHQGGFCSAAGKKLVVADDSRKGAEKLYESVSKECFESAQDQFPSFSSASGKKIRVTGSLLEKGKKLYESTSEETQLRDSKPSIFQKASTSCVNKHEVESFQQGGFCSAAGKKLVVADDSRKGAEKLYESVSKESFESAQDLQFPSFSSAAGKKIRVTGSLLEKGKKLYESTIGETKLHDSESTGKIGFPKSVQSTRTVKMNVTNESLRRAHKLFDDCFDKDGMNDFMLNPVDASPQLSTFTSAAGKSINVAEKKLFNAQKIFQSVSAETVVSMEKMRVFADFLPYKSEVSSNIKPSDVASRAAPCQRLKRSLNEDTVQNVPSSSNAGKKLKTDENVQKFDGKSDEIVEFGSCEETLKVPSVADKLESGSLSSAENNCALEPPIDARLLVDNFSICSENDIFQKSPSLDDTVLLNSAVILSDTDSRADDLPATEPVSCIESNSSKRKFSEDSTLLNICQEVSESTSAFLFDMKNDDLAFDPVQSPNSDAVEESETKTATPTISRSSSPVFDSSKPSSRKKYKRRRSQHSLSLNPLDVTYVRKEGDAVVPKPSPEEVLKMLNQNFAQKVNKRKEPSSNMMYPSSKKAKDSKENDILEQRKRAAAEQQKLVSQKDEQLCKPRKGAILTQKLRGDRKSLREMVNYEKPQRHSVSKLLQLGLKRSVVNVNPDNANEFIFTTDFLSDEGSTYGDECVVIPNEKNEVYFDDLARAFLASPGVDPRLISLPWIRNHYRWIIWKLASTEKSYPNVFGGRYLTLNNVLLQLKFRYDWEVDRCCRSALKRILECDSSPSETMILCVASIKTIVGSLNEYEIEMTDGWYSVSCLFDGEMMKLLTQKKVAVGTKLMIMNAELTGAGDGCDPLQANKSARLKIATNSVRRARWYAPLGFHADNPIVVSDLRAILPNGGTVPQFTAVIARVYPMLYLDKKDDGSFTLHNEKVHFKKMADFEKRRQMCLDRLVAQITTEVEKENPDSDDRNTDSDSDPIAYQNRRYREQERLQILIQERVKQKLPEEFKSPKRASSMLKVRLINKDPHGDPLPAALLTIWHPPEDLVSLLSETKLYEFHKVAAGGLRNGEVQLTANRQTKYKHLSAGDLSCFGRRVTSFSEMSTDFKAAFGEVDIVGLVISVRDIASDSNDTQTIYLADLNKNLMIIKFRTNVKNFGFEDTLKLQNVIAGLNLQWKRSLCNGQIPIVFASELTSFVYNSRCQHLQKCIDKFHSYFKTESLNDFIAECKEKLKDILASPGPIATSTPERSNQRPFLNENSVTTEPANASLKQNNSADSTDASWNTKSKSVHSRIEKLRGYGEPPPLSPISMCSRRRSSRLSIQTRVHKLSISKN